MKSTCALTTARLRCVPPCSTNLRPTARKRPRGVFIELDAVALGDALEKRAIARGALRVQAEVGDGPLTQKNDLDVASAHIADHVGVGKEMQSGRRMRHRLDDRNVGAENVLQQILAVAGDGERADLFAASLANRAEHFCPAASILPSANAPTAETRGTP